MFLIASIALAALLLEAPSNIISNEINIFKKIAPIAIATLSNVLFLATEF